MTPFRHWKRAEKDCDSEGKETVEEIMALQLLWLSVRRCFLDLSEVRRSSSRTGLSRWVEETEIEVYMV